MLFKIWKLLYKCKVAYIAGFFYRNQSINETNFSDFKPATQNMNIKISVGNSVNYFEKHDIIATVYKQ